MDKNNGNIGVSIFMFILAGLLIFFSVKQTYESDVEQEELIDSISSKVTDKVVEEISNKEVYDKIAESVADEIERAPVKTSKYPDYNSLAGLEKLNIADNFESWTPNAQKSEGKIKRVLVLEKGELSKAYIYIRASLDGKALSKWESIYLNINNSGGHLFRPASLAVPESEKTELLYAMDEISYLPSVPYSEKRTPLNIDWFSILKPGAKLNFYTFISSMKPAFLEEMTLYYDCVEGSDCLLSIQ